MSGVAAISVAVPVVGFVLGPLFQAPPPEWRKVGAVENFKIGETTQVKFTNSAPHQWAGAVGESAAWLRREDEQNFKVFSVNCTHLGCPVEWKPQATLFFCPCHGGVYYKDGKVAAGPPPHPLPQYPVRVNSWAGRGANRSHSADCNRRPAIGQVERVVLGCEYHWNENVR